MLLSCSDPRKVLTIRSFIEFVQPICLPFEDDATEKYKDNYLTVAGWGYIIADVQKELNGKRQFLQDCVFSI